MNAIDCAKDLASPSILDNTHFGANKSQLDPDITCDEWRSDAIVIVVVGHVVSGGMSES